MRPDYDPHDDPPWAMQLVVRAEKAGPPAHGAVCEAAATAVVRLLTDPRAAEPGGEWHDAVREWEARRIRKVTRRARGVRWPEAEALPGVTVDHAGAQVRAFPPGPVSDVPSVLAKLQVAGLDLAEAEEPGPPPEPPYAVIAINPDVTITTGKAAAQCGHAAQLLLRQGRRKDVAAWVDGGARVHLIPTESDRGVRGVVPPREAATRDVPWRKCVKEATVAVRDGGFTEVPPGTMTAIAWIVRK
ncbi:peptidyl-tRNA hydrolase [Actinomadura sp. 9N215]|uniref:peptidyl-tRNA hydrolase n=1 Tax=Actinomadura sp. 9N215 TaxID=3375150 RepID=UPI0037B99DFB